jgi:hypothetical protein
MVKLTKKQIFDILYVVLIIVVIAFCIFLYFYLTSQGKQCLAEPLKYYQAKTNTQCMCWNTILG